MWSVVCKHATAAFFFKSWSRWIKVCVIVFVSASLKRTTDIMFGGKQVVVCGYGEVTHSLI